MTGLPDNATGARGPSLVPRICRRRPPDSIRVWLVGGALKFSYGLLALAFLILIHIHGGQGASLLGPAIIVDGDTLRIGREEVRIYGIDAPETRQKCQLPKGTWDCSTATIAALAAIIGGKEVRCQGNERDNYGRLMGRCSTKDEPDIGAKLVSAGLAWASIKYSSDYSDLERVPRSRKQGIWQSRTQPPWEYRAKRWTTAQQITPQGCPIKGNINAKGEKIYYTPWYRRYSRTGVDSSKGERWFCDEFEAKAAGWRAPYP